MKIIVHYPNALENKDNMKKTAEVHANAVLEYVKKLPYSKEQKIALLKALIRG